MSAGEKSATPIRVVCGIDVGGTRTKVGLVDASRPGRVMALDVFPTERESEGAFYRGIAESVCRLVAQTGTRPVGAGVSIGSYVFSDGTIDGLSSMVPFLTHGHPLGQQMSVTLGLPVRVDNDARLICMAEALAGEGRGFGRVLTLTLGTGIGFGLVEDGQLVEDEPRGHLAGHVCVRERDDDPWIDESPCYCGLEGCLEQTCSGTALERVVHRVLGPAVTNKDLFQRSVAGDPVARRVVDRFLGYLLRALNQYVYLYCPDVIVLGGGVARGLESYVDRLQRGIVAEVYQGQHTELRVTRLREESGVIGAAGLVSN